MLAALLREVGSPLELVERPVPDPGPGEVRIAVQACGVCGSDLFLQAGGFGTDSFPLVPGHEAAGVVDAVGAGVEGWEPGDQAALYYIDADPNGRWSRAGRENLDPDLRRMGVDVDGAFAEFVVRPAHTLVRPPKPIDPTTLAVLTDAVATPHHALRLAEPRAGETALVLGIGGIGSNAVQLAASLGLEVVAASRSRAKLELAAELGAARTIALEGGAGDLARIESDCPGPQIVLQCAGSAKADRLAIDAAGPGGRVVLVGASREGFEATATELIWRELQLIGSRGFTRRDIAEVLDLYCEGRIAVDHLTRSVRPLAEANEALDDLRSGRVLRTVLRP